MKKSFIPLAAMGVAAALVMTGCGQAGQGSTTTEDGRTVLTMWTHSAGNPAELAVYEKIISDFNASQDTYEVKTESFPQGAYNDAIVAAAASGDLPCLLDLDGPIMPNWAWANYLQPLNISQRHHRQAAPDRGRKVQRRDLLRRVLGRGPRHLRAQVGAGCQRHPHPEHRPAVERVGVRPALATLKAAGYDTPHRHRRRGQGRVVAVRLLAVPAELRRRPDRPLDDAVGRRHPERTGCREVGHLVPGPVQEGVRQQRRHRGQPGVRRRQGGPELHRRLERPGRGGCGR